MDSGERNGGRNVLSGMGGIAVSLRKEILKPDGLGLNPSLVTYWSYNLGKMT